MIMSKTLNKQAVARWLVDQQALAERIQAERVAFLLSLTPERSLRIYLGLQDFTSYRRDVPSPVLVAMRQALCRIGETQDERASSGD
ncbi:MAG: hypothetical protein D6736_02250 [Nitrospinota bacterium]|nr:MAG: hypothetical protein D6736_02250 [Nitrospinota bacterium]